MIPSAPAPADDTWRRHGDTIGALLTQRGEAFPDRPFLHLVDDPRGETCLTFGELARAARRVAGWLQATGVARGERVMLVLPTGTDFVEVFFGAQLAGCAAVPCYPPHRRKGLEEYQDRLARQIAVARPAVIVAARQVRLVVEAAAFQARVPARVVEPAAIAASSAPYRPIEEDPDAVAVVQFSSGSTGHPRGVTLTHRHLLANIAAISTHLGAGPDDINCCWLPLYHDMGLIGGLLGPVFCGISLVLMGPQTFLLDPKRWLWAIHRHRATISTAPNFAYQLIASRVADAELAGLDLSSWRLALCGAEPVVPATMDAFATRMAGYGFRREALLPVYGLAEVALGAVFPQPGSPVRVDAVDPDALVARGEAAAAPAEGATSLVAVGRPLAGYQLRIVGPDGRERPERAVGEIQLQGPSVMAGYLGDAAATRAAVAEGWLHTGDLGYMADGELFVVGRLKDVVIKGGRNYAPQDLEEAASQIEGVRRGCVAAFGVPDPENGTEAVVVVAETRRPAETHAAMVAAIGERVQAATGLRPDHVLLVPPGSLPKTSSGKLQRGRARERWLSGTLCAPAEPGVRAMARVVGQAMAQRVAAGPLRWRTRHVH